MYLLCDIGGTHMRVAVSSSLRTFRQPVILRTPRAFRNGMHVLRETVSEMCGTHRVRGVAVGIAGPLDRKHSKIVRAPHLRGWNNKPLRASLTRMLRAPVHIENDAAMVGLGEATYGAGKGKKIVAYITVSTGVGGARIEDGRIDAAALDFEPGNQWIEVSNTAQTLEDLISGTDVRRRRKKPPTEIHNPAVWNRLADLLGIGLANTAVHWSPDIIVVGGAMIFGVTPLSKRTGTGIRLQRVRKSFRRYLKIYATRPRLVRASLGQFGGLYGAMTLLRQKKP